MALFELNFAEAEKLQKAMENFEGNTEAAINDVLHNYAGEAAMDAIRNLIPVSGKQWKGKLPSAKSAKSLETVNGNLSVTVTTTKNYQYLYFPNDGTTTRRHVGNQQFFERGGEAVKDDIIQRCINKLTSNFEKGV